MAYLFIDKKGKEVIVSELVKRNDGYFFDPSRAEMIKLPTGTIEKLIGHKLTWEDEPVELTEEIINGKTTEP
jgi:predicted aminopeptidase